MAIQAPQTSFTRVPDEAVEGHIHESWAGRDLPTGIVQTTAGIPVGRFCIWGTSENQIDAIDATGDVTALKLAGVTAFDMFASTSGDAVMWARYDQAKLLRKGKIWMHSIVTIANNVTPFIIHTGADAGRLSATADDQDTGESTVAPTRIKVVKGRTGAGLVLVEINLI